MNKKIKNEILRSSFTLGSEIETPAQAKQNLCNALSVIDAQQKKYIFTPYLSQNESDTIKSFNISENSDRIFSYRFDPDEKLVITSLTNHGERANLKEDVLEHTSGNEAAASFIETHVIRMARDMAKCFSTNITDIRITLKSAIGLGETEFNWHRDGGNGIRIAKAYVGPETLFTDDDKFATNKNIHTASPNEITVFRMGHPVNGALHAAPIENQPRIFALLECKKCEAGTMAKEKAETYSSDNAVETLPQDDQLLMGELL